MTGLLVMIKESGFAGLVILVLGSFALALVIERARALFYTYSMKTSDFGAKIRTLVMDDKLEDAITLSGQYAHKPMAKAVKIILERADRDDESLYQAQDIALSENIPQFSRRLNYLMMIANVSTLVGLLGTIHGLIMAFSAVSQADPATKQTLLAEGISIAMNTTALGLSVAIPTMIAFAILQSRQNALSEELIEYSNKIIETLTSRQYKYLDKSKVYPNTVNTDKLEKTATPPPPPTAKSA